MEEGVRAPRVHWDGATLQVEPGFTDSVVTDLQRHWPVNVWPECNVYFGGVNAVAPNGHAAGDPRRGGTGLCVV